jgi:hypothetical protein
MKATQHRQPLRLRGRCAATACSSVQRPCPSATANAVTAAFSCSSLPVTGVPRTSQSRLGVDHHRQRRDSGPTRAPGECLAAPNSRGNGRCMASRGRCGLGRLRLTGASASPGRVVTPRIPPRSSSSSFRTRTTRPTRASPGPGSPEPRHPDQPRSRVHRRFHLPAQLAEGGP